MTSLLTQWRLSVAAVELTKEVQVRLGLCVLDKYDIW